MFSSPRTCDTKSVVNAAVRWPYKTEEWEYLSDGACTLWAIHEWEPKPAGHNAPIFLRTCGRRLSHFPVPYHARSEVRQEAWGINPSFLALRIQILQVSPAG